MEYDGRLYLLGVGGKVPLAKQFEQVRDIIPLCRIKDNYLLRYAIVKRDDHAVHSFKLDAGNTHILHRLGLSETLHVKAKPFFYVQDNHQTVRGAILIQDIMDLVAT